MNKVKTKVLISNELKKLKCRKYVIVLGIIVLALSLISAVGSVALTNVFGSFAYSYNTLEDTVNWLEDSAEWVKEEPDEYFSYEFEQTKLPNELQYEFCMQQIAIYKDLISKGVLTENDWRFQAIGSDSICSLAEAKTALKKLESDPSFAKLPHGKQYYTELKQTSEDIITAALDSEYYELFIPRLKAAQQQLAAEKNVKYDTEKSAADRIKAEYRVYFAEAVCEGYKYIVDNKCEYGNAVAAEAEALCSVATSPLLSMEIYTADEFRAAGTVYSDTGILQNYEQYIESIEKDLSAVKDRVEVGLMCIRTDSYDIGVEGTVRSFVMGFFGLGQTIAIICIVITSGIIANEFSSRTIHMLVIRPVSRKRLLFAKYVAALICSAVIYFGAALLNFIVTIILSGAGDLFQPMFFKLFGTIVSVSFPLYYLGTLAAVFICVVFLSTVAFAIATLSRNNAAGIAVGTCTALFSSVISAIVLLASADKLLYTYLPTTYFNMWSAVNSGISAGYGGSISDILSTVSFAGTDAFYGTAILVVLTVAVYMLASTVFRKRDIS